MKSLKRACTPQPSVVTQQTSFSDHIIYLLVSYYDDRLCGLVVRVSGYRYRGLGFDSRRYQIF